MDEAVKDMKMHEITTYLAPRRLEEALQAMADGEATLFCGGTDLAPQTESGARHYKAKLLNLRRIDGLDGIDATGDEIRIGAATTSPKISAAMPPMPSVTSGPKLGSR